MLITSSNAIFTQREFSWQLPQVAFGKHTRPSPNQPLLHTHSCFPGPMWLQAACKNRREITAQKATINQVTTMLATSKNVLFPGPNHLLTIGIDDLTL